MTYKIKRLKTDDYEAYRQIRIEGFTQQEREFRFSSEDEINITKDSVINRLNSDFIIGVYQTETLIGIGGLTQFIGSKLHHRALLWGMYVRSQYRGKNVANNIMNSLIDHAVNIQIEKIILTVVSDNIKAIRFYKKWKFTPYAIDANAIKLKHNEYLDEILMVRNL